MSSVYNEAACCQHSNTGSVFTSQLRVIIETVGSNSVTVRIVPSPKSNVWEVS
jgi:hypothetical protein